MTVLTWVGSKAKLAKTISAYAPLQWNDYYEPFAGTASLYLHLRPANATLSDRNADLINFYRVIREFDYREGLVDALKIMEDIHNTIGDEYYYQIRDMKILNFSPIAKAARFYFLNRTSFNGLWRVNQKGNMNTPHGRLADGTSKLFTFTQTDLTELHTLGVALYKATLKTCHYSYTVEEARESDFVYFDPPYHGGFSDYTMYGFTQYDQVTLYHRFNRLSAMGVKVLLSNSNTEFIQNLYQDYEQIEITRSGCMNSDPDNRGQVTELLIRSYTE